MKTGILFFQGTRYACAVEPKSIKVPRASQNRPKESFQANEIDIKKTEIAKKATFYNKQNRFVQSLEEHCSSFADCGDIAGSSCAPLTHNPLSARWDSDTLSANDADHSSVTKGDSHPTAKT